MPYVKLNMVTKFILINTLEENPHTIEWVIISKYSLYVIIPSVQYSVTLGQSIGHFNLI